MDQLNIFDLTNNEVSINPSNVVLNNINVLESPRFIFEVGSVVEIFKSYKMRCEVLADYGDNVELREISEDPHVKESFIFKSDDILCLIVNERQYIPLPKYNRTKNIDLAYYQNAQAIHLSKLLEEDLRLDMITYMVTLGHTGFLIHSEHYLALQSIDDVSKYTLSHLAIDVEHSLRAFGFNNPCRFVSYRGEEVKFDLNISQTNSCFDATDSNYSFVYKSYDILLHFFKMKARVQTKTLDTMNPYELMFYYRLNGYLLKYHIETTEWVLSKAYSDKSLHVTREELNQFELLSKRYKAKFERNYALNAMTTLLITQIKQENYAYEQNGFIVPKGTIVEFQHINNKKFVVISDNGNQVEVVEYIKTDDFKRVIEPEVFKMDSILLERFYTENNYTYFFFPKFNRPKELSLQGIYEKTNNAISNLSQEQLKRYIILEVFNLRNSAPLKIIQAIIEGDDESVFNAMKESSHTFSGCSSTYYEYAITPKGIKGGFGTKVNRRNIELDFKEILSIIKTMMIRATTSQIESLSVEELRVNYALNGLDLSYDYITDEFQVCLIGGTKVYDVKGGRRELDHQVSILEKIKAI